jgi:chitinase
MTNGQSAVSAQQAAVRITRPDNGTIYRMTPQTPSDTQQIPVQAIVADTVRLKQLLIYVDERLIGTFTSSPARAWWTLELGTHTIKAQVIDDQGQVTESAPVSIVVTQ